DRGLGFAPEGDLGVASAIGAMTGAGAPAEPEITRFRIADRPPAGVLTQGQDGRGGLDLERGDHDLQLRIALCRRADRRRPRRSDAQSRRRPAAKGSWTGRNIAPRQTHAVHLADHRVAADAAEAPRHLAGAHALQPHRFQRRYALVRPVHDFAPEAVANTDSLAGSI